MAQKSLTEIKTRYGIVGNCDALNRAIETALKVAAVDLSVLIIGENGAGKESFPRLIHDNSIRVHKRYMAVNCGAIPEGTIDSELFGHVKGAFTGAVDSREGYFGVADGGTLFLDEVGELPLATQARLLRVLETGEYIPVGSNEVRRTNVRIVAATNVNIPEAIRRGRFRQDLFYRLNAITVSVPPLRERGGDIQLLFLKFAQDMKAKYGMPAIQLAPDAKELLTTYTWPGNIRQLLHVVESLSVTCDERIITAERMRSFLPEEHTGSGMAIAGERQEGTYSYDKEREIIFQMLLSLRKEVEELRQQLRSTHGHTTPVTGTTPMLPSTSHMLPQDDIVEVAPDEIGTVDEAERDIIRRALERNGGNRAASAREIGMAERTFYRKLKEYGLG